MFYCYIIYSDSRDRYYVGHTNDLNNRVLHHRRRKNLGAADWLIVYTECFDSRGEAMKREAEIKLKKSRSFIQSLIKSTG